MEVVDRVQNHRKELLLPNAAIILGRAPGTNLQTAIPYERYEIITNVFFSYSSGGSYVDILRKITLISDASPIFMKIGN
jgi:hypothetical protein